MPKIEEEFSAFAQRRAEMLAPGLDFEKPKWKKGWSLRDSSGDEVATNISSIATNLAKAPPSPPEMGGGDKDLRLPANPNDLEEAISMWISTHPTNFYALNERARRLTARKDFQAAKEPLEKLVELYPEETGSDSASAMLAAVYRELGETNAERNVLSRHAEKDDEAIQAYQRLMELDAAAQDWQAVVRNARRFLAVNPLVVLPYQFLARASEKLQDLQTGIMADTVLLELDPADPVQVQFHLAQLLHRAGDPQARRHVLQALEEAPR